MAVLAQNRYLRCPRTAKRYEIRHGDILNFRAPRRSEPAPVFAATGSSLDRCWKAARLGTACVPRNRGRYLWPESGHVSISRQRSGIKWKWRSDRQPATRADAIDRAAGQNMSPSPSVSLSDRRASYARPERARIARRCKLTSAMYTQRLERRAVSALRMRSAFRRTALPQARAVGNPRARKQWRYLRR